MSISKQVLALAMRLATQCAERNKARTMLVCPKCRGYALEKQYCDRCERTGFILEDTTP